MRIVPGDFNEPRIVALLQLHVERARAETGRGSDHALDLAGLQAPDIRFWAAWEGGELLGVGALKRLSVDHGEVKSMHVVQDRRRTGAGSAMLRHLIASARAMGLTRLSLETGSWAYFTAAQVLYRKHGFVECLPFGDYLPDRNSVFMTLDLGEGA